MLQEIKAAAEQDRLQAQRIRASPSDPPLGVDAFEYPTINIRKYTPGAILGRPIVSLL